MPTYRLQRSSLNISLTEKEFIGEGGEGKVYAKNGMAYKIGGVIPDGKIQELLQIVDNYILVPEDSLILKNKTVGYSMRLAPVENCWAMPLTFTNTFWQREGMTTEKALEMVMFLRKKIEFIHSKKCLLVDLNPFNFLICKNFKSAYLIDTGSFQTKSYPATAIMPSVQCHHTEGFNENSDWFSFGLLTFELLTGLHAYRSGSYSQAVGDKDAQMTTRMLQNVSVLNTKVKFPQNACRPFSSIPQNWLDWYTAEFERGQRLQPPTDLSSVAVVNRIATTRESVKLNVREIFSADETIQHFSYVDGKQIIVTKNFIYTDGHKITNKLPTKNLFFHNRKLYSADTQLFDLNAQQEIYSYSPQMFLYNGALYSKNGQFIQLMKMHGQGEPRFLYQTVAQLMPSATFIGDNFLAHNLGGANYIVVLDYDSAHPFRIKELDGSQIFAGKEQIVWTRKGGVVAKHIISFKKDFQGYSIDTEHIDYYDNQVTKLDNGIMVQTLPDGNLKLSKGNSQRIIEDTFLSDEPYILGSHGAAVQIARHNLLLEVSLK